MNPQSNRGKRRSSVQKEEPTKRRAEEGTEKEKPEVVWLSGDSNDVEDEVRLRIKRWDDIGTEEEKYLENTRKELYELIMKRRNFESGVAEKSIEKLEKLMKSLLTYGRENIEELQILESDQMECETHERSSKGRYISLITFQHRRIRWMIEEVFGRCRKGKSLLLKKTARIKILEEENGNLRKGLEKVSRELEELQRGLVSRETSKRDVAVSTEIVSTETVSTETASTETETPEVEMRDEQVLSTPQGIPQNLVGTLEEVIERKMGEILSRVGFPLEGKTKGWKSSGESKTQTPTRDVSTCSEEEVVKRSRGKPSIQREAISSHGEKERELKSTERLRERREKKKRRKEWPTLSKTAAVVLTAPTGKEANCAELLRRAKEEISIEEIEVPPWKSGVPGQGD